MQCWPRQALTIDLSNGADGNGAPIVMSWGVPSFDASTRAMSIRLQSGKTPVFHGFRTIPDPDADGHENVFVGPNAFIPPNGNGGYGTDGRAIRGQDRCRRHDHGSMDRMKSMKRWLAATAVLGCSIEPAVLAATGDPYAFGEFQKRFGGHTSFVCTAPGGATLNLGVDVPAATDPQIRALPHERWNRVLSVYLSDERRGSDDAAGAVDASWGEPSFDATQRFMSVRLHTGRTLVFRRFGEIPAHASDERHFDRRSFFELVIDGTRRLSCAQRYDAL